MNIRNILGLSHKIIPFKELLKISNRKIFLPFYHAVSDQRIPHISNLYPLRNTALFIKDLDFFCKHYQPVSLDTLYKAVADPNIITKPIFHLTFDDGLSEVYHVAAPILEKKGIPATVFLNSSFIDNKALFYRYKVSLILDVVESNYEKHIADISQVLQQPLKTKKELFQALHQLTHFEEHIIEAIAKLLSINFNRYLIDNQPYMTSNEILDLMKKGFTIGSHSMDHPIFKKLTIDDQKNQVTQCLNNLEKQFGLKSKNFSFPFTDDGVGTEFFNWLYKEMDVKLSFGISGLKDDFSNFHLHRVPMEGTLKTAEELVKSEYLYYLLKATINKNKIERQ